jgi:UDP:flavonoid glycosyltransferase YjiC (YdhE family)
MRFSVVTVGSEGDTRPLAALCRGLLDRGHDLRLFADDSTLTLPRALGVPCEALRGDIKASLPIVDPRQKLRFSDLMRLGKDLKAYIASHSTAWLRSVGEHADRSDAILFSSLALGVGVTLREELGKPAIGLAFQPGGAPTREFSAPGLPPLNLPAWLNPLTHKLAMRQLWSFFAESVPKARREVFGTTVTKRPAFDFPMLYGVSKELVAQPADWPADHVICGHWSAPIADWQVSGDLIDFIGDEPPIYAGFGSPSAFIREQALKALVEAVAGRRVLFSPGWSKIDGSMLPDNFFIARDVPHEWLFPRCSLTIHHGGAGTTHTAARAGAPQVILPFGGDQLFWAGRLAARGVAPKAPRGAAKKAPAIAKMIAFAELDSTRQRATELAQAMAREDGVGNAVREIEALVARRREPSVAAIARPVIAGGVDATERSCRRRRRESGP